MILKFPFLSLNTQFRVLRLPRAAVPWIIIKREDYISCSCNCSRMCFFCFYRHFNVLRERIHHKIRLSNNKTTWCVELYLSLYLHECAAPPSTWNKEGNWWQDPRRIPLISRWKPIRCPANTQKNKPLTILSLNTNGNKSIGWKTI